MMGIFKSISGTVELEMTSADIAQSLENLTRMGIPIYDLNIISDLTVVFQIPRTDFRKIKAYAEKRGISVTIRRKKGLYWAAKSMLKRPALLLGMGLLVMFFWFVPGRVFLVEVQGNATVPTRQILEAAAECGIRFGISGREVRSEKMKNAILSRVPQLQWAGINTYGSRAVITVRERSREEQVSEKTGVSSIVASRDGIVVSCTVSDGNGLVAPGQVVQAGQMLISGYTDCGLSIEATRADGEVIARTRWDLTVKSPEVQYLRSESSVARTKYSLQIGKKRINFYKGSGISDGSCVKMYSKYVLTLPGGFSLPVILIRETVVPCVMEENLPEPAMVRERMTLFATQYLRSQMIAGSVLQRQEHFSADGGFTLIGQYECQEMIGRVKPEQIGVYNGKTD